MYRNLYTIALGCSILLLVFVLGFLATSGGSGGQADFVWNNATEPQTLDPGIMSGQPEGALAEGLFEGLTNYHPKTLKPLPGVAESWESDGLTYTFHLRRDAWWVRSDRIFETDGKKRNVVAGDFVYAWRRMLHPESGAEYSYLLHLIDGAQDYERIVGKHWTELIERWNPKSGDHPAGGDRISIIRPDSLLAKREDRSLQKALEAEYSRLVVLRNDAWRKVGIRSRDDYTLEVVLRSPAPYFLDLTSFYPLCPVPREIIEAHGLEWILLENIVTNGPFYLLEWRFNSHIRMKKNVHYWEDADYAERRIAELKARPASELQVFEREQLRYLETAGSFVEKGFELVDALAIEQETTGLNLYLNGDVDRVREIPTAVGGDILEYSLRPGNPLPHLHHGDYNATYYYNLYLKLPVFSAGAGGELGRKLRHALALSVDRETLTRVVTRQHQKPAYRIVFPAGIKDYSDRPAFGSGDYSRDLAEAKRLVAEVRAGGVSIPKLQILYNTKENHAKIAVFIQGIWKRELEIEVELANQEWGVFLDSRRNENYQIARSGWIGDYADPNTFLDMFTTGNQNNDPKYSNPHFDRIVLDYCANILEYLATEVSRRELLMDVRSWRSYAEAIHDVARPDETRLGEALESALDTCRELSGAARNHKASEIRLLLFEVAEAMLFHDMVVIPLYFYTSTQLWPPELEGYHINTRDVHPLKVLRWKGGRRPSGNRYDAFPRLRAELPERK